MGCDCSGRGRQLSQHFFVNTLGGIRFTTVSFSQSFVLTSTINSHNVLISPTTGPIIVYFDDLAYWIRRNLASGIEFAVLDDEIEFLGIYDDIEATDYA